MDGFGAGIGAGLGALGFWGFVAAVSIAGIWANIRKKDIQHETLRRMIENGSRIDQDITDKLLQSNKGDESRLDCDLKVAGVITLFLAPGLAILGWFLSFQAQKALLPLLGVASLVGCLSLGLLIASKISERWYNDDMPNKRNRL